MSLLAEKLTYDQFFRMSEPKRVIRSYKVKGPPLEVDSYQDTVYYAFNFKADPSTTGLRHRGFVKFFKPRLGGQKPLQHIECLVDCTCPDYKFMWAWANKQRGSGRVGTQSMNQCLNRAPRKTNPTSKPGLCKHILAMRSYIYGLLSSFPSDRPDVGDKLDKLTRFGQGRWRNFQDQVNAAKERERRIQAAKQARNVGAEPYPNLDDPEAIQPPALPPVAEPNADLVPLEAPPSYAANIKPPSARGRTLPVSPAKPAEPKKSIRRLKKSIPQALPDKGAERAAKAGFDTPAEYEFRRRQGLGDSLEITHVVNANGKTNMKNILTESLTFLREMEDDELRMQREPGGGAAVDELDAPPGDEFGGGEFGDAQGGPGGPGGPGDDMPVDRGTGGPIDLDLPPTGAGDAALGADTEGDTALSLLRDIRNSLQQLASAEVPEPDAGVEDMTGVPPGGPGGPGEGEEEIDIPVEEPPGGEEEGGGEDDGGEEEGGGEDDEDDRKRHDHDEDED
jgi:hypothetical protein